MAILTKAQLEALNQSSFPDQSTEAITPAILRTYNTATIDTLVDSLDTGSFATSAITASSLITASVNLNTITFTKGNGTTFAVTVNTGSGGGGSTDISSLNAFTASQLTINSGLNASTASQQISINNLNTTTASINSSITQLNASSASQQISINALSAATASYVTSAITASSLVTASVAINVLTFTKGDGTQFNLTVASSGSVTPGTISGSQQITNLGFVSSSVTASSLVTASFSGNTLTFTKGDSSTFGVVIPDISGSTIDTGSFVTTSSFNAYTASVTESVVTAIVTNNGSSYYEIDGIQAPKLSFVPGPKYRFDLSGIVGSHPFKFSTTANGPTEYLTGVTSGSNFIQIEVGYNTTTPLYYYCTNHSGMGNEINVLGIEKLLTTASFNAYTASQSTINTGSFATTGSNVFIGDETFQDASGNASTLSPYSGSIVFVAKGSTSGSAGLSHITSSTSTQVNLIFKASNAGTGSLTISGSNNILLSPSASTAGFVRYVGERNILLTTALPEMTGSLGFSPALNGNIGNNIIRFRGPASSSAWSFSSNILNGNLNVGNADATPANQAVAGGTMGNNILISGVNYNAYTTPLVASANFGQNLCVGNSNLTAFSSSIQANFNIFNGNTFTVNNSYFGTASTNAAQRLNLQYNVFGGINTSTLTASGSNTTTSAARELIGNTTNGSGNLIGVVLNGDNSNLYSTLVHGSNLTVTGSSAYNTYQTAGGAFIGRNNSVNGTAARSGETIFAVGTGTGTFFRKTGFLIDSGSNTFIEGTLNVSGSTSFNGAVNITGSLTSSLTLGYVWVGGAGNVSTLVATSSFAGGSVPTGTVSGSSQITALGFVSSSVTASSLVTASVNLNTITFTKGDASTFAITVDTGSGGGSVPAGTVSSSAQIVAYNKFATTGSNTFNDYQIIKSNLSFQESTGLEDNNIVLSSLNKATLYIQNTSISTGYNSGSVLQLTTTTGSTGYGSGSAIFQMDATYAGNRGQLKVGSTVGLGSYVQGFGDDILFAKSQGFPNTPSTTFKVDAASIELSGSIKVNTGSSGSAGIVNIANGGTVTNGLVTSNSIILVTTQELGAGNEYPASVSGKTNGSFVIDHNYGSNLNVAYLIINPLY